MRGRQVLMQTLVNHGVERIFGNPGTTESPLLDSLLDYPSLQYIVHLHEGVAVGAANYYAQASGKTAFVNLHVAPGLGNALGMIYGALKGELADGRDCRPAGHAPAAARSGAGPRSRRDGGTADEVERAGRARRRARADPAARLQDRQRGAGWPGVRRPADQRDGAGDGHRRPAGRRRCSQAAGPIRPASSHGRSSCRREQPGHRRRRRRRARRRGRDARRHRREAWRRRVVRRLAARNSFPTDHPAYRGTVAFEAAGFARTSRATMLVLLLGGPFFEEVWYAPGSPFPAGARCSRSRPAPRGWPTIFAVDAGVLAEIGAALEALGCGAPRDAGAAQAQRRAEGAEGARRRGPEGARPEGLGRTPTSMARCMAEIRAACAEGRVVVEESITANLDLFQTFTFKGAADYFSARGGGIGQGVAGAIGVAVAQSRRPILCLSGDGSAMYSIQALWTAAHHDLPIVFVILANREYRVLKHNIDAYRDALRREEQQALRAHGSDRPGAGLRRSRQGHGDRRHAGHQGRRHQGRRWLPPSPPASRISIEIEIEGKR